MGDIQRKKNAIFISILIMEAFLLLSAPLTHENIWEAWWNSNILVESKHT